MSTKTRQKLVNYGGGAKAGAGVSILVFSFVLPSVCDNVYFQKHFMLSVYFIIDNNY